MKEADVELHGKGGSEQLRVMKMGRGRYRLLEAPVFLEECSYDDVIEAGIRSDRSLAFKRIAHKSDLRRYSWIIPKGITATNRFKALVSRIEQLNGYWQLDLGGYLQVFIPPWSAIDPETELDRIIRGLNHK